MVYMVGISTAKACLSQPARQHERARKRWTAALPIKERHAPCSGRWNLIIPRQHHHHHHQPVGSQIRALGNSGEGPERRRVGKEPELTVSGDFSILPQPGEPREDEAKAIDASAEEPAEEPGEEPGATTQPAALESSAEVLKAAQEPPSEDKTEQTEASSPAAPPAPAPAPAAAAAASSAASSRAASEGRNQKAGKEADVPPAPAKPPLVASGSGAAPAVMTAGSPSAVALVHYSDSGLDELTENLLRGPFGPFVKIFMRWRPPKWMLRTASALILSGQVISRIAQGKIHWKNTIAQLRIVGPSSLGVCLLTASFVGMVFTIQFAREFTKLGLTRSIGGVLALALARELVPVITSIILAGRVGSAFAAELGTMQVSQQTDTLWVLQTDPVDYLVTPRVLACVVALPMLVLLCFTTGMAASVFLADGVYDISANIMLDSAQRALAAWDIVSSGIKSVVFGFIISTVSCSWGYTTTGGAKGVGESTTSAVVISLVSIFVADFILSYLFFQGQGDAIKQLM